VADTLMVSNIQMKSGTNSSMVGAAFVKASIERLHSETLPISKALSHSSLGNWIRRELDRCDDPAWASIFEPHAAFFKMQPDSFLNRIVRIGGSDVLCAIRFYGGDFMRPFVDVFAWTGALTWQQLMEGMSAEWAEFMPNSVRILTGSAFAPAFAVLDQTVHFGMPREMLMQGRSSRLALVDCDSPEEAFSSAKHWYGELRKDNAALADEVSQSDIEDLGVCREQGILCWIMVDGMRAGLVGLAPGHIAWLGGMEVNEEILAGAVRGQGLGRFIQSEAGHRLVEKGMGDVPVIGTIQRLNEASRRTAVSSNRPAIMQYSFLSLGTKELSMGKWKAR
jgi:hypothetical protein